MSEGGGVELERRVESILVGERHRRDVGDLTPLMESMKRVGLLQPITITPDGFLICGYRRLEAAKRLGWTTLRVWVRSGISDSLTRLLAERDDNVTHKPLAPLEAAHLFEEMKSLLREDAERRKKASQFGSGPASELGTVPGSPHEPGGGGAGGPDSGPPQGPSNGLPHGSLHGLPGRVSRQAALMVTQKASHARLEQILEMERIAADKTNSPDLRTVAEAELEAIRAGGAVDPSYQRVKAAQRAESATVPPTGSNDDLDARADEVLARAKEDRARRVRENRQKRASAAASAKRSPRAFVLTWAELDGWSKKFDVDQIAHEVLPEDWALFLRVLDETKAFAEAVTLSRG